MILGCVKLTVRDNQPNNIKDSSFLIRMDILCVWLLVPVLNFVDSITAGTSMGQTCLSHLPDLWLVL